MALRQFLLDWRIELRQFHSTLCGKPHYQWIKRIELFTRRWNALQTWVFVKATCNFPDDGLPTEVEITGRHEFLRGGISNYTGQIWI